MSDYQFDHIHLNSPDPLRTAQFYESMFGARRMETLQLYGGTVVRLDLNGQQALIGPPVGSPPLVPAALQPQYGLIHFGIRTDNLEKAVDELKAKGVTFVQEITPLTPSTSKISYFLAPEHVLVELQQR
jgi:catechol 2,3-dioxygenase-like lactoylglutathione lyase family enzyme